MLFAAIAINYLDRVNISHTIILMADELSLSATQQGLLLSGFSIGYVIFMAIGGILSDRYGGRFIIGISCLLLSVSTIFIGFCNSFISLLILRILVGIFEAPVFPACAKIVANNFPPNEKSRATAFFDSGSYVGSAFAAPVIIFVMINYGWRYTFYASGFLGLVWFIVWFKKFSIKPKPVDGFAVNNIELFRKLLKSRKMVGVCLGFFCYNYLKNFFLTWFPSYLAVEKQFSFLEVGIVSFIPPVVAIVSENITGYYIDKSIKKGIAVTYARKIPLCLGMILSSVIIVTLFTENIYLILLFVTLSYASLISASPSIWSIPSDISPNNGLVATVGGFQNTFSNLAGIIAPLFTGILIDSSGSFMLPIIFSGIIAILGAVSYWFVVGELKPIQLK